MSHSHTHDSYNKSTRRLSMAIGVNLLLTVVQVIGGWLSGSLSLIADALHNLSDAGALMIAAIARKISGLPATSSMTYGYGRAEILGALINSTLLVAIGCYLIYEAISRFFAPAPVEGAIVIGVASVALVVDLMTAFLTYKDSKDNLNIRAAFIHNMSDALASVAVIISGVLVLLFDVYWVDWATTLLISSYILYHSFFLIRESVRIIMQAVPEDLDLTLIKREIEKIQAVREFHHVHVWQVHDRFRTLEGHLVIEDGKLSDIERIKKQAKTLLSERFEIGHSTLEVEISDKSCETIEECSDS